MTDEELRALIAVEIEKALGKKLNAVDQEIVAACVPGMPGLQVLALIGIRDGVSVATVRDIVRLINGLADAIACLAGRQAAGLVEMERLKPGFTDDIEPGKKSGN